MNFSTLIFQDKIGIYDKINTDGCNAGSQEKNC